MAKRPQNSSTGSPSRAKSRGSRKSSPARRSGAKASQTAPELIAVTFVEDMEQAREYETLLEANGIPATIKQHNEESADTQDIAIMVPEDYLDEAHVVIESQDAYDDFYDFALEDEDEGDFDRDFFEDNF
jgi:hypothetical protein